MNRRDWMRLTGIAGTSLLLSGYMKFGNNEMKRYKGSAQPEVKLRKTDFGPDFIWGVAAAAYQTEGGWNADGKSESNWDHFAHKSGNIERNENADVATDFYHRYAEDIELIRKMNFRNFRFSLAWSRILPNGTGEPNRAGLDFYHKVIDKCFECGIEPWITIYHWDMPQVLEEAGGWTNREIIGWFSEYVELVTREFGAKVKNWMVMNEQLSFVGGGYLWGNMAPGKKSVSGFMKAAHHSVLCNAEGGRIVRRNVQGANVGTTFFTAYIEPVDQQKKNIRAAERVNAGINRMFIEPLLGMGYPEKSLSVLSKIRKYFEPGDEERIVFDFDFIGVQYYFRAVVESSMIPWIRAREVSATERIVESNSMGFEMYPEGLTRILKQFAQYLQIKKLLVTENGTCVPDVLKDGRIADRRRKLYFKRHLAALLQAKQEGVNVDGYFVWSPTDNFEWDKGFRTRFGLVHVDFQTQERTIKDSGLWFQKFLK